MPIRLPPRLTALNKPLLIAALGLVSIPAAAVASSCAEFDPQAVPAAAIASAVEQLQKSLTDCQTNANWLAGLGHLMNRQGNYVAAAEHLERALMLAPTQQSIQIDYAIAMAGMGDMPSAVAMLQALLANPELPAHVRIVLANRLAQWGQVAPHSSEWQVAGAAAFRVGYDSNLLAAPNLTTLTLTFPGQPQELPLDENYRPKEGGYYQADAEVQWRKLMPDGAWDIAASLRTRNGTAVPSAGVSQYELLVERSTFANAALGRDLTGYYLNTSVFGLNSEAGTHFEAYGLGSGWGVRWGTEAVQASNCQVRLGGELQDRRYTNNELLSGHYAGAVASWGCVTDGGTQWQASVKVGADIASSPARAGGDQTQASVRLVGRFPASKVIPALQGNILADAELASIQDKSPYSALLDNGSLRMLQRNSMRVEYQQLLVRTPQWAVHGVLGVDWAQQQSNLPLFALQTHGTYLTFRVFW